MATYGYARVSSIDQNLQVQTEALKSAGCEIVRAERASGTSRKGRPELESLLEFLRAGDTLVVTKLDRLARSVADLSAIVALLEERGAKLRILNAALDTGTPTGRAFLQMLGVFSEFETAIRRERQMEGIASAKAENVYKGRKRSVKRDEVVRLHSEGMRPSDIAKALRVARASVYRALAEARQNGT
ncbi:integrase [Alsobacter soli]|uniref:Integrase n=1 Tax=Alsobacter soli TaxID=2109933 RepID=A0A2T1HVN1_9HYPH|nr:recombinase family protein [Alsobacter soli]PSC05660.1 integrase [Alsobacter soli]